ARSLRSVRIAVASAKHGVSTFAGFKPSRRVSMPRTPRFALVAAALTGAVVLLATAHPVADNLGITTANWGAVTSPVFGTSQSGIYGGAEMFAGPFQFDNNYFHGVLPNGRLVRPAGGRPPKRHKPPPGRRTPHRHTPN